MFADMGTAPERLEAVAQASESWLRAALADGRYFGWLVTLAEDPSAIVAGAGMIVMDWPPTARDQGTKRAYLLNVYTEPEHRRRGLARRLTAEALREAERLDIRVVTLHASEQGRALYEQLGFEPTNEMRIVLYKETLR